MLDCDRRAVYPYKYPAYAAEFFFAVRKEKENAKTHRQGWGWVVSAMKGSVRIQGLYFWLSLVVIRVVKSVRIPALYYSVVIG